MSQNEDLFLKIINREIPADIVYEDDKVIAFKDISPSAPVHLLIVPLKHIKTTDDIQAEDKELIGHIVFVATKLARENNIAESGYRMQFNCREHGGQMVYHIHLHLVGGKQLPHF
ncbi:MAG: histidine triad nucleotide-binding protein [Gammaproteobacteria bacterium]|nr:histidine triad nucleotide-binding protein [Gammaproteobacteria bacterium]